MLAALEVASTRGHPGDTQTRSCVDLTFEPRSLYDSGVRRGRARSRFARGKSTQWSGARGYEGGHERGREGRRQGHDPDRRRRAGRARGAGGVLRRATATRCIGAESARRRAGTGRAQHPIDLALVDINMPGEDGLSLARHLRERYADIAIVMLTSAGTVVDRIVGLEMGADDYVPKPFDPRELRGARQERAAPHLGRGAAPTSAPSACASGAACSTSPRTGSPTRRARRCAMSPLEFDLLKALAEHPNRRAVARAHPESQPAARLGPVRPQRRSAHHAPAQEDRARSRASAVHPDHAQRGLHVRARTER